jgi:hypothetical protein
LEGATQQDLVITDWDEPTVAVDNIEVAQFIYLMLHNEKIRDVIDTIGKKDEPTSSRERLEQHQTSMIFSTGANECLVCIDEAPRH